MSPRIKYGRFYWDSSVLIGAKTGHENPIEKLLFGFELGAHWRMGFKCHMGKYRREILES